MLKVKRKFGESIVIGNIATVTILGKSHGGFTIGIEAPRDISVHRGEIQEIINGTAAAESSQRLQLGTDAGLATDGRTDVGQDGTRRDMTGLDST